MEQCYRHRDTGETAVAAYLDYNRVYVADWGRSLLYQLTAQRGCRVLCRLAGPPCVG